MDGERRGDVTFKDRILGIVCATLGGREEARATRGEDCIEERETESGANIQRCRGASRRDAEIGPYPATGTTPS